MRKTAFHDIGAVAGRRPWWLFGVVLVLAVASTACASWSQLAGSESRAGYQPFEFSISPTNVASLAPHWSAFIGGYHGEEGRPSAPVIANGVVYLGYGQALEAFDAAGKGRLWTAYTAGSTTPSTAAVANGV